MGEISSHRGPDRAPRLNRAITGQVRRRVLVTPISRSKFARVAGEFRKVACENPAAGPQTLPQSHSIRCDDLDAPAAAPQRAHAEPQAVTMQRGKLGTPRCTAAIRR